jgi:hypothetical protein
MPDGPVNLRKAVPEGPPQEKIRLMPWLLRLSTTARYGWKARLAQALR